MPQSPKLAASILRPNSQIKNAFCFRRRSSPGPQPRGTFGLGLIAYCDYKVEKTRHFAASTGCSKAQRLSASGGLRPPDPPTRGSAPGPRWGRSPQTPVIGSRSTRSPCAPPKLNSWIRHCPGPRPPHPSCFVTCGVQKIS